VKRALDVEKSTIYYLFPFSSQSASPGSIAKADAPGRQDSNGILDAPSKSPYGDRGHIKLGTNPEAGSGKTL
jgi:hypothetical protein